MESIEERTLKKALVALTSDNMEDVKLALTVLIELYQKQSRRTDKMLKTSDHFQSTFLTLSERLSAIKESQDRQIHKMIVDQKQRAKNILYSRKSIYEAHKKEVYNYQISINELTDLLQEKNDIFIKYNKLQKELKELRKTHKTETLQNSLDENFSEQELEYELEKLKERELEKELLNITTKLIQNHINSGFPESSQFSKIFLREMKSTLEHDFLTKNGHDIFVDKLSRFIIRRYLEDILSTAVDIIIQSAVNKTKTASDFIGSFSGKIVFDEKNYPVGKNEIIDSSGNKWTPQAILQIFAKRNAILKQIQNQKTLINALNTKIESYQQEISRLNEEVEKLYSIQRENKFTFIDEKVIKIPQQNHSISQQDDMKIKFLKQLTAKNTQEINGQKRLVANETGKLLLTKEQLTSISNQCDAIISAFVKNLMI